MTTETRNPTDSLLNVHQALAEASQEARQKAETVPTSVRLHPVIKEHATVICARNGTDLSSFLRKCTEILVREYHPAPTQE